MKTSKSIICMVLMMPFCGLNADSVHGALMRHKAPISQLHRFVVGDVLPCCGESYQKLRLVNNRACINKPAVIVRPATNEDVSIVVFIFRLMQPISISMGNSAFFI